MPDLSLYALARATLDAVEAHYASESAPHALPERRYVSEGVPAWDCEQLTVRVTRLFTAVGSPVQDVIVALDTPSSIGAEIEIELVRCTETPNDEGDAPTGDAIETAAQLLLADALDVFLAVETAAGDGSLPGCRGAVFVNWTPKGPDGGLVGGTTLIRLTLE